MGVDPNEWLSYGPLGAISLVFFLILTVGLTIINRIFTDGRDRDQRLINVLEKNGMATQVVGERLAAIQMKLEDIHDSITGHSGGKT